MGGGASNTFNVVQSFNGTGTSRGSLTRNNLSGTGERPVRVGSTGYLVPGTSDARLKDKIAPLTLGVEFLDNINPKQFIYKDEPELVEYGLIAQELKETLRSLNVATDTNLVYEDSNEHNLRRLPEGESGPVLGIEYTKFIPILINSIKELKARIETLERERNL
jgi:hypothetical protein